jgi:flagellar hook-length control protein FliK
MAFILSSLGVATHSAGKMAGAGARDISPVPFASSFGNVLNAQADAIGANDPLAALAAMVQNGTPISSIVDTIANQIADAVGHLLPASQLGSGASRASLIKSITTALSPPSNAPPGTSAAQQVAALARQLQQWLGSVAREADQQTGQQNDISGTILDANTAKEIPAQSSDPTPTSSKLDVFSLSQSLIRSAIASLAGGTPAATVPAPRVRAVQPNDPIVASIVANVRANGANALSDAANLPVATNASIPTNLAAAAANVQSESSTVRSLLAEIQSDSATLPAPATTRPAIPVTTPAASAPNDGTPPAGTAAAQVPVTTTATAPAPQPAMPVSPSATSASVQSNPTDLVARMLIRAAGVDATFNANLPTVQAAALPASTPVTRGDGDAAILQPTPSSAAAAKVLALLTDAVASAAQSSNDNPSPSNNGTARDASSDDASAPSAPAKTSAPANSAAFALPNSPAPASLAQTQNAQTPQTPAAPDPAAIVEQLVKSMAMRTGTDGTSEIRLRLQPENLGTVTLKLTVDGNSVSATATAANGDVRAVLLSNQHQLARSLADAGLKLTGFSVDVSGRDAKDSNQDQTSGFGRRYTVHELAASGESDPESSAGGPPLVAGSTLGLLSYLA